PAKREFADVAYAGEEGSSRGQRWQHATASPGACTAPALAGRAIAFEDVCDLHMSSWRDCAAICDSPALAGVSIWERSESLSTAPTGAGASAPGDHQL